MYTKILPVIVLSVLIVIIGSQVEVTHAVAAPEWWSGTCNVNNHPNSHMLGTSYNGVVACGPGPAHQGGYDQLVRFAPGLWGEYEWECVELSMRYMYLVYGITPYNSATGKDVVVNYNGSRLEKVSNSGTVLPTPGDILSMGAVTGNEYGHTAIVIAVNVNSSGTGTLTLMEQNGAANSNGSRDIAVTNKVVGDNVTAWLHDPYYSVTTFQANTGNLFTYSDGGSSDTHQGMMGGTSPSASWLSDGSYATAFVTNTGELYVYNSSTGTSSRTYQGVRAGTSPSMTGFGGPGWQVVFQGADGLLHGYSSSGNAVNFGQSMQPGTSPSIVALPVGGWRVAYQMSSGSLALYSVDSGGSSWSNLNQGMSGQSSPSITSVGGSSWVSAFRANTGDLAVYNSSVGYGQVFSLGMATGTSPSVTRTSGANYVIFVQANTGQMWKYDSSSGATNTSQGLLTQTSPNTTGLGSSYITMFQANTGYLYSYINGTSFNTLKGMAPATSPALVVHPQSD